MRTNVSISEPVTVIEQAFHILGQQTRIQILLVLSKREACVCHIEAVLGIRQAAISQHLMVLRDADLVTADRDGRNIFYRIQKPELLEIIYKVASLNGISTDQLDAYTLRPVPGCPCPQCNPDLDPELACKKTQVVSTLSG